MSRKIIITGATGLIGKKICTILLERGDKVTVFTRSPERAARIFGDKAEYVKWNYNEQDTSGIINAINYADAVIHLAGENVMSRRWNETHKERVLKSRMLGTRALVNSILRAEHKPEVFISASAVGYYGTEGNKKVTETSNPGTDFLANVTGLWEQEVKKAASFGMREVRIRTGIVLDKNEGALARMLTPFRLFIGGPLGSGKQWFPWIHIDDVAGIFLHTLDNPTVSGPLNAVAPVQINMNDFSKILGNVLHRPSIFRVPEFVLRLVLGEGAESIVNGSYILPKRTLDSGYNFKFDNVESALNDLLE